MTLSPRAIEAAVKAMKALEDEATADPENIFGADLTSLAKAAITAALAVDGLCLVPKEPTEAMIEAGCENNPTQWNEGTDLGFAADVANDVYRAMIAAASTGDSTREDNKK